MTLVHHSRKIDRSHGMTLVEVLVVIAIIGVLRVGFVSRYPDTPGLDIDSLSPTSSDTDPKPIAFVSAHPGSCGMVTADGSVRTTDSTIAAAVHQALASRNGGQLGG